MANFQLADTDKVPYKVNVVDADGNPAGGLADGSTLKVSSSDETMATVVEDNPAAGGPGVVGSGWIYAGKALGTVQINAQETKADGSAGFNGSVMIDIVGGAAALLEINLGTPVDAGANVQPPAPSTGPVGPQPKP